MSRDLHKSPLMVVTILVFIVYAIYNFVASPDSLYDADSQKSVATLERVVDGDTVYLNIANRSVKVRLLYIDTPESTKQVEPYGKEASEYTGQLLSQAGLIQVQYNPEGDRKDNYGRALLWVFVDGELLQTKIARAGYCEKFYDYGYDYLYEDEIVAAHQEAIAQRKGIYE